jgi:hypothetical protein
MAKASGIGDNFYVGGYDLSGDVASVDMISTPLAPLDVTPINKSANARIFGLRDGDMQFTSFFEFAGTVSAPGVPASTTPLISTYNIPVLVTLTGGTLSNVTINGVTAGTAAGTYVLPAYGTITLTYGSAPTWTWKAEGAEHDVLSSLPRTDTIASYLRGTTLLNPTACINGKQVNYDPTRDASGNLTVKTEVQGNSYGLEWGKQLTAGLRTDTTATVGTFVDDSGAIGAAFGCQAYLQLVEFIGTSVDVKITHCATSGGSYTTLLDFGAQSAVGSFRQAAANGTTVNRYLEVTTTGTFSLATFAVGWMRNQALVSF